MEKLPDTFCVIRPGYGEHEYISLCRNTIQIKDGLEWNAIEYLPTGGTLVRELEDATYEVKVSRACWKGTKANSGTMASLERGSSYYYLPFKFRVGDNSYPLIYFFHTGFLPGNVRMSCKQYLTDMEKLWITLEILPEFDERVEANQLVKFVEKDIPLFVMENHVKYSKSTLDCPILYIPLNECSKVSMLDCYHVFDSVSIQSWLDKKPECPVCKNKSKIIYTL